MPILRRCGPLVLVALVTSVPADVAPAIASAGEPVVTTTVPEDLTATTSSSTSSTFVSGGIGECAFDVIVADGGAYGSLWLTVDGGLQNTSCRLASSPQLAGAILTKESFRSVKVASIAEALPPGSSLLHCDTDEFIEGHQVVEIDFLSFGTTGVSALGPGGESVSPPRLCIRGISCSYFGGGDLDWMGDPECGDADYDDAIEAGDALRALRTAVGQPSCEPVPTVCDTNSDQQVTAADALGILRASIQLDVTLVCPPPCAP